MFIQESVKIRYVSAILPTGNMILSIGIATLSTGIRILSTGITISSTGITISSSGITILSVGIATLSTGITSIGITIAHVRIAAVGILQSHERIGLLADLLFHTRVVLKIRIELRMALQVLRVVDQGRRLAKLVGNFAMSIEKLVKSRRSLRVMSSLGTACRSCVVEDCACVRQGTHNNVTIAAPRTKVTFWNRGSLLFISSTSSSLGSDAMCKPLSCSVLRTDILSIRNDLVIHGFARGR